MSALKNVHQEASNSWVPIRLITSTRVQCQLKFTAAFFGPKKPFKKFFNQNNSLYQAFSLLTSKNIMLLSIARRLMLHKEHTRWCYKYDWTPTLLKQSIVKSSSIRACWWTKVYHLTSKNNSVSLLFHSLS